VGIFEVGAQVDQHLALIHITDAQKLFRLGSSVDGLRLKFDDFYQAPAHIASMKSHTPDKYQFTDWSDTQGSLFRAVKLEKTVTGLLLGIIILVAAFNIVTGLIMMVTEKRSDIAVLRTMGMSRTQVLQIFVTQGFVTALIGVTLGLILGVPVAIYLPDLMAFFEKVFGLQVFDPDVYYVVQFPSRWMLSDTINVAAFALVSALISSIFPAYRASQILPADAMRYDA
jgi:lipoprotein-releasing system permease protein